MTTEGAIRYVREMDDECGDGFRLSDPNHNHDCYEFDRFRALRCLAAEVERLRQWQMDITAVLCLAHPGGVFYDDAAALLKADIEAHERLKADLATIQAVVAQQAEDPGLWAWAATAPEAYLQAELRRLHAEVEGQGRTDIAAREEAAFRAGYYCGATDEYYDQSAALARWKEQGR